jgi:hypothetical protein
MLRKALVYLLIFLRLAMAQTDGNATDCSHDLPEQMGSGGGILMFFLGFMTGALVIGLIWLLMDQRGRSWHFFGHGGGYAPVYPAQDPAQQPSYPMPQPGYPAPQPGYPAPAQGYPPQQAYAWAPPAGLGGYKTEYELITPQY